jgi:hypothetical protein
VVYFAICEAFVFFASGSFTFRGSLEVRGQSHVEGNATYSLVRVAGAEAEDSVLLQSLIDNVENNPGLAQHVNEEDSDDEAELRARVLQNVQNVAVRSLKAPARMLTVGVSGSFATIEAFVFVTVEACGSNSDF